MESAIQKYFENKTVFLTGGTGFLGKVIVEKLLRTTEVKRIYLLIRPKRGVEIQERISEWSKDSVFELLLKSKSDALQRVCPIAGDCLEPDLGISDTDRRLLASEVQIVLHGAATVRFNEPLHVALAINTRATRLMVQLGKQMVNLEAFVHVSTAFSNCIIYHVKEKFYPEHLTCSSDKVLGVSELLSDELIDNMTPTLLGSHPNSYTYTKALAEDVILREGSDLPICIFRPAVIIASHKEPISGWIDNLYGPIAILFGVARGVLRIATIDVKAQASLVPVDYCANLALACAWKTAQTDERQSDPIIYQLAPTEDNSLTHGEFKDYALDGRMQCPLTKMVWYPFFHCITTMWLFPIAAFFYHTLPAYIFDLALYLSGRKPRLVKVYQKIHKTLGILGPFSSKSWYFDMHNTNKMRELMSEQDRRLYDFDMASISWKEYFEKALLGMRLYLGQDPPTSESIAHGLRVIKRLKMWHHLLQVILGCIAAFIVWSLIRVVV
ncbi:GL27190 [Drosophila persimilis]|uniref:Fatty acyl-CoA reductase n=1 Tax=Drosophila persimilis TaxID=7234 RepID=B4GZ26_DROPE|nr:fatty acyl-CoA reductase wat [Drosophila persimilis]EDW28044.1 GL27190 [Drosophila persimilis]